MNFLKVTNVSFYPIGVDKMRQSVSQNETFNIFMKDLLKVSISSDLRT